MIEQAGFALCRRKPDVLLRIVNPSANELFKQPQQPATTPRP